MSKIADKILSRIDIVANISDKALFIQAADEINILEEEIQDLRQELDEAGVDNKNLLNQVSDLEDDLWRAENGGPDLAEFDTSELFEELESRGYVMPTAQSYRNLIAEIKTCIDNNDTQHLAVLFARLEEGSYGRYL